MTLSRLVLRSMRKNIKQYYLYFFALIFSVTLCFSYTTLQYNPTVVLALEESGTASAGFKAATYVLYFIVTFFVLYASHLFMKRRSKEIGIYQLIGMTKGLVFRLIALENIILFLLAVIVGMVVGYFSSRFFAMVLLEILEVDMIVQLKFSVEAFKQSAIIFSILLVIILLQMAWVIRSLSLLSLFTASKKADEQIRGFSIFQMVMGFIGLFLIIFGYYQSTQLFNVEKSSFFDNLYLHMLVILGATIIGTYLFFRYTVALIMNMIRAGKRGHLRITDVLAVTPIMHKMKSNSKSLTLITTLTGLAVGIMSLAYIAYYSSNSNARFVSPYDYILLNDQGIEFLDALYQEGIKFEKDTYQISSVKLNIKDLVSENLQDSPLYSLETDTVVVSLSDFRQIKPNYTLKKGEALLTSYANVLSEVLPLQKNKDIIVKSGKLEFPLHITEIRKDYVISNYVSNGSPILVVSDKLFKEIEEQNKEQQAITSQIGINLVEREDVEKAEMLYKKFSEHRKVFLDKEHSLIHKSFEEQRKNNIASLGLTIFVTAFLGLAFLLTTGSILYFKQIAEADDEKESYVILRKIGFSTTHIMKGIYAKQAFNFGVPLIIGLFHSYFAVKSGWWLFGTELVAPLIITICLYVVMYTVFAVLSIQYYKKVVRESL
ncbi:FtsX-like permease family protein [Ureibacillus xyleni]|uniref:FtsX-like permease family protein n=1 Tax=Ureibacillus xyleni TaxID=614648 RepID=A0A285SSK6_9BACL|nr:ABC transporter permease [Ureibacillus xyleni]SOC09294.1 FtsX-like permease family protein [Ureibacillus xyleni]